MSPASQAMFRSTTDEWSTPSEVFDPLNEEFGFTLDVCADADNAKCGRFFDKDADGLTQVWSGVCWMNPPYGRGIDRWIHKAWESARDGATVVCLIPSRTDTRWWHDYVTDAADVRFVKGRIYFENPDRPRDRAPFPSAIVVFRPAVEGTDG